MSFESKNIFCFAHYPAPPSPNSGQSFLHNLSFYDIAHERQLQISYLAAFAHHLSYSCFISINVFKPLSRTSLTTSLNHFNTNKRHCPVSFWRSEGGARSLVVLLLKIQVNNDLVYPGPSVKGSYGRVEVFLFLV